MICCTRPSEGFVLGLEVPVSGGGASTRVGAVNDVVVGEGRRVKELEGCRCREDAVRDGSIGCIAVDTPESCSEEFSTQALAATQETASVIGEELRIRTERCELPRLGIYDRLEFGVEQGWKRSFLSHPPSLAANALPTMARQYPLARAAGCRVHLEREDTMALSEHEQRLLDEMERQLYANDADVVSTEPSAAPSLSTRSLVLMCLAVAAGIGVILLGVAFQQPIVGVIGFALMLLGVASVGAGKTSKGDARLTRPTNKRPAGSGAGPEGRSSNAQSGGQRFMDQLDERWDRRRNGL